ncbi:MAG: alpha/beta fold hydrolase [Actinomycetota bacterium]
MTTATLNGFEISYDDVGPSGAQAVLFTHGYQASRAMWEPQHALAPDYRVITWDIRGHGSSGDPDDPSQYSQELMLDDMGALLDHLGVDKVVLVGHSLGGFASLRFYLDNPDRVNGLVLFGSGPGFRDAEAREKWNAMAERFAGGMEAKGLELLQRASQEVSGAKHRSAQALAHAARGILKQHDSKVMDALTSISVPTISIVGSEDERFIGSSTYLAKKIPGARFETIEGAAHAANMEQPDAFNQALRSFLDAL